MTPQCEIRPATPEDSGLILDFIRALAGYEKLAHEVTATEAKVRETLFGAKPSAEALLAFSASQPAGFAVYFLAYSTFCAQPVLYLEDLFVKPHLRARGIGKALFSELLRIAQARGCARFEWSVLDWNQPAIQFYQSLGAKPLSDWTKYRLDQSQIHSLLQPPSLSTPPAPSPPP